MEPLISPEAMVALTEVATSAFQTDVVILRRSVTVNGQTIVSDDYGDDAVSYTETSESRRTVKGSLSSTPTPVQEVNGGQLVTVNTYKLALPVGTDIIPGDEVTIGGEMFSVSDTTNESTWQALLLVSVRRLE